MLTDDEKIISAKALLLTKYPFFGSLLSKTNIIKADGKYDDVPIKTMFTEGLNIYYFSSFINKLSVRDVAWAFTHELLHIINKHPSREKNRQHMVWAIACDYAINPILFDEFNHLLDGALYDGKFRNKSAEEIYDTLMEYVKPNDKNNAQGISTDEDTDEITEEKLKEMIDPDYADDIIKYIKWLKGVWNKPLTKKQEEELEYKIISAYNQMKLIGHDSYIIDRIVKVATAPILDWRDVLAQYIEYDNERLTYRRYNRKYIDDNIYMPIYRNEMFKANIAFDVSGSIPDALLEHFFAETLGILSSRYDKMILRVFQVDTAILSETTYSNDDIGNDFYIRHGNGGTDFCSFFKKLNDEGNEDLVIFFTDGDANIPSEPPTYPVIWIYTHNKLKWGINIKYEVVK